MDCSRIQEDGWVVLHEVLHVGVVGFDAQHDFEVVAQVLFVDLLQRGCFECLLLRFEAADVVDDLQSLVLGLVEWQVPVVEQVVDVVGHALVVEVAVGQHQALAFEFAVVEVGSALHHNFLESVLEFDLLVVTFDFLYFQLALPD